jgi:hypothetical protein
MESRTGGFNMKEIITALAKALPEVDSASKDKSNPAFRSKYADLGNVIEAIRPIVKHGLWYRQETIEHEQGACVETFYLHISGEEKSGGKCFIRASKQDAHGFGSALTYCRRYGLMAAFGIAPEDDDGNAAVKLVKHSEPINQTQCDTLRTLIEASGSNIVAFCKYYEIESLPELPANKFAHAEKSLQTKLAAKGEKE